MRPPRFPTLLIPHLPFFYGWVVLGCICLAGFARQGPAVAVLSIFVEPMTREFGWSRAAISGAVSLGGVLAAIIAPFIGPLLDRRGARLVLCLAVLSTGLATMALSLTPSLLVFYLLFCFARMNWAGPFELGLYSALNNWFVARRPLATAIATLAQMGGLVGLPLIAQAAMQQGSWREGWLAIGATVLLVGFLPVWLLMVRRPEDVGLTPDRQVATSGTPQPEPQFTRGEALRLPAFWLLALYTVLVYPVQAGVSLHQAAHLIERGIDATVATGIVSFFSLMSGVASFAVGFLPRRWPVRYAMAAAGALLCLGAFAMTGIDGTRDAFLAAALFGAGIGGVLTLLPIAWADYFGRASYGAIRGVALSMQVLAQATGPLASGALRDWTGDYMLSLHLFTALAALATLAALAARQPRIPARMPA